MLKHQNIDDKLKICSKLKPRSRIGNFIKSINIGQTIFSLPGMGTRAQNSRWIRKIEPEIRRVPSNCRPTFFALQRLINKFQVRLILSGKVFKIGCLMSRAKMIVAFVIVIFKPLISANLTFFPDFFFSIFQKQN